MKKLIVGAALGLWAGSMASGSILYEPFNYTDDNASLPNGPAGAITDHTGYFVLGGVASPETPTTPGRSPDGVHTWAAVATTTTRHDQGALTDGLSTPSPITAAVGKSYVYGGTGEGNRINIGTISTGVVYYSLEIQVQTLGTTNNQLLGFNNVTGTQTGNVTQVLAELLAKPGSTAGSYKLGIGKNAGSTTYVYDEADEFTLGAGATSVFVVGSYDFGTSSTTDAVSKLWINPDPATFGTATPPDATVTSAPTGITDISSIASFVLYQYGGAAGGSGDTRVDELRVDTTWAGVTPVPEPGTLAAAGVVGAALAGRRRRWV